MHVQVSQYACDTSILAGDQASRLSSGLCAVNIIKSGAEIEMTTRNVEESQLVYQGMSLAETMSSGRLRTTTGETALKRAAAFWLLVAVIGQWTFVVYIVSFYGGAIVQGDFARWGKFLTHGLVPGDNLGNLALATHLTLAAVITAGGPLQLVPQIRARVPLFHRWSGRVYLFTAFAASISALYLLWIRNERIAGDLVQHLGVSLDAVLILFCGAMALRYALARQFSVHRRWAMRLFLAVSGVWFFRVGLFFWLIVNRGPAGFDPDTFQGPFLNFLSFADSLLPLAVLELYLRTQDRAGASGRIAMAAGLSVLTVAMGVGIFGAFMNIWLPNI
jgi:Predicted membrane protein (DUF2306)